MVRLGHGQLLGSRRVKVRIWNNIRRRIKPLFLKADITTCELRYPGCTYNNFLGFAHAKKRRNLPKDGSEDAVVILACTNCHTKIERATESDMGLIVMATIAARQSQPHPIS